VSIQHSIESHQFKPEVDYLVLDGIPRNIRQARLLNRFIEVRKVFHLHCPDRDAVVSRLKKRAIKDNRLDDANETVIRQRLETYERESKPLLNHYESDLIVEIDATKSPVTVLGAIVSHIIRDRETEHDGSRVASLR
jgi:adenylate kinase